MQNCETSNQAMTVEQAIQKCTDKLNDPLAAKILVEKYLLYDQERKMSLESSPEQMWDRLSIEAAKIENDAKKWTKDYRNLLDDWKFVPGGRILYGLGNPFSKITLKNCYVIGIQEDSIKGIFDAGYQMAETYKYGGGCGIDISTIRPKGYPIHNAARESTGSVSFMDFFSHITGMIGQKARMGALLICIDDHHPDIEDFISIKGGDDLNLIRFANISVKMTDKFMKAVEKNEEYPLIWNGEINRTINARELWNKLIHYSWKRAEPGILFWDAIMREVPANQYKSLKCIATNPCGEVPSSHGDSCNLGSMNLSKYVINPYENDAKFDYDNFKNDVCTAVRFLDAIITLERSPLPFQQKINDAGRKLGLGVMGYADTLIKLKIKYGSEQSMQFTEQLFKEFMNNSYHASCNLAEEKGPFPLFNAKKHLRSPFIKRLSPELIKRIKKVGLRNVCLNSIAPTGSISNIARCSSGIEPIFMIKYKRKTNLGTAKKTEEYTVHHPTAKEWLNQNKGKELPDYFISAHQTDPLARIKLQGIMQKYIDLSISNTVNLPKTATEEEISKLLQMAWSEGCKGITIYRDESREGVLVKDDQNEIKRHHSPKRPITLPAKVHIIQPNGHAFTIFLGFLHGKIYEVFALDYDEAGLTEGQSGEIIKVSKSNETPCSSYNYHKGALVVHNLNRYEHQEASMTTRLISTSLRHGVPIEFIVDQILKSKAPMNSFARAIARALSAYIDKEEAKTTMKCEKCKSKNLKIEGTCWTCNDCGQSKCG